ncbi:hypothetical protein V6N11_075605 [Hibiscus sabdariffa]|uniref:Uncharacterized protein n=1 Tax=Hibiscus sabdariffa TaxID=183260 RepID=A0ABR2R7P7_9ROSI
MLGRHGTDSGGTHLVNWDTLCTPVTEEGLGMKHLSIQNDAFIMKLTFDLMARSGDFVPSADHALMVNWMESEEALVCNMVSAEVFDPGSIGYDPVLMHGYRMLGEFRNATVAGVPILSSKDPVPQEAVRWELPPNQWCKLNANGACCSGSGIASCGGIVCDDSVNLILESDCKEAIQKPNKQQKSNFSGTNEYFEEFQCKLKCKRRNINDKE